MKLVLTLLLISSLVLADTNKWGAEDANGVSALTNDNFDEFVKSHPYVFVKFFAPWCGHCKSMAESYAGLARKINENGQDLVIAELDATLHPAIASKFGVKGYPSLKFFSHGEPIDYSGEREAEAIENWIEKKLAASIEEITTMDRLTEVAKLRLAVVLYAPEISSTQLNRLKALAGSFEKVPFFTTTLAEAKELLGATGPNSFVVFRSFDDGRRTFNSDQEFELADMKSHFDGVRFAAVLEFDEEAAQNIFGGQKTAVFYFSDSKEESEGLKAFNTVAALKQHNIIFSKSTIVEGLGQRLAEYIGVTVKDEDSLRLVKFNGQELEKFKLENITVESLKKFLDDFVAGNLKTYRKSEKPVENDQEPVKTIVGDNFDDLVINNDKYVLLEIYAAWCGQCKILAPIYEELGKKFQNSSRLVIAKMDGTLNENPAIKVEGFPTIFFFKKGSKDAPVTYANSRDIEGFTDFLRKEMGDDYLENETPISEEL